MSGPEYITNTTNYSGIFETGVSYKKFDFVYNTGDSRFYYAKEDMQYGGGAIMEGANRFYIEPDGPQGANGLPTHYIHDELNELTTLENQIEPGHTIHLTGTLNNADGYYNVLQVERDISLKLKEDQVYSQPSDGTIDGALDSTDLGIPGFKKSDWFIYANKGTNKELDSRTYYVPQGTAEGWIYHLLLGWIFVSPHATDESIWFWIGEKGSSQDTSDLGNWIFTSTNSLGSMVPTRDSFMFVDGARPNASNRFGPVDNWIHWEKSHDAKYAAIVYNYGSQRWYGLLSDFSTEILDVSLSAPALVTETLTTRRNDGQVARIQIQGIDENTKIEVTERPSDNFISIKSIVQDLSSTNTFWSKDSFFFDADYGSSVSFKANNYKYEYGNGYYTLQPKSVNALSFQADLKFKNRTNREANAIIHFLENHQGQHEKDSPGVTLKYNQGISGFKWDGNATFHPYDSLSNQSKDFYCSNFSHSLNFENSNDLNITLTNFNTSLLNKSEELFTKHPGDYNDSETYALNDVVFETGSHQYYYCHTGDGSQSAQGYPPVQKYSEWTRENGIYKSINTGVWTRDFFWKPSLGMEVAQNPRLLNMTLGGGYNQVYRDGDNESLLDLNLQFNNRSDEEAYAIVHFLEQHYGAIPFKFSPPAPYEFKKNFVCQEWVHTYNYKNNHSISAKFEEFPVNLDSDRIINNSTPSPALPADVLINEFITIASEEDQSLWSQSQRKRISVENVGGEPATVNSLFFNQEAEENFKIIGKTSLGETYRTATFDGSEVIDSSNSSVIDTIYLDIIGAAIDSDTKNYYSNKVHWKTSDLIEAIINSAEFLEMTPNTNNVEILYLDLLGRASDTSGMTHYTSSSYATVQDVINNMRLSEEYRERYKNDVKIIPRKVRFQDKKIIIPDHKLKMFELNGKRVELLGYAAGVQTFKTDSGQKYFQYDNGAIKKDSTEDVSQGESVAIDGADYFVSDKYIKKFGSNVIGPYEQGFIDVYFQGHSEEMTDDYLIDHDGNKLTWSNILNEAQGAIKISSSDTWIYGNLNLTWGAQTTIVSEIKTWITSSPSRRFLAKTNPWYVGVNDLYEGYLKKSLELLPAPEIKIKTQMGVENYDTWDEQAVDTSIINQKIVEHCKVPIIPNVTLWGIEANNISSLTNQERTNLEGDVDAGLYRTVTEYANGYLPEEINSHSDIVNEAQINALYQDFLGSNASAADINSYISNNRNARYVIYVLLGFSGFEGKIVFKNEIEIDLDFISHSARNGLNDKIAERFKGLWASYEIKLCSTGDGGILLPEYADNQNVNQDSGWTPAQDLLILGPINDDNHTTYEIVQSSDSDYSRVVIQRGMCRLNEQIIENDVVVGYRATAKIRPVGNFSLGGDYQLGGAGNLEIKVHDFATKYGIVRKGADTSDVGTIITRNSFYVPSDFRIGDSLHGKFGLGYYTKNRKYYVKLRDENGQLTGQEVELFNDTNGFRKWLEDNDYFNINYLSANLGTIAYTLGHISSAGGVATAVWGAQMFNAAFMSSGLRGAGTPSHTGEIDSNYLENLDHDTEGAIGLYDAYILNMTATQTVSATVPYTIELDSTLNMWKVNGTFVPDLPEFKEFMQLAYPSGIEINGKLWNDYSQIGSYWSTLGTVDNPFLQYAEEYARILNAGQGSYQPYWYNIVDQSGENYFSGYKDIKAALDEWNRLKDQSFKYKQLVYDKNNGEFTKFCHILSLNAILDGSSFDYDLDQDSKNQLAALDASYASIPGVNFNSAINSSFPNADYLYYGGLSAALPGVNSGGLKIDKHLYIELSEEQERELNLAIELIENVIQNDMTVSIYFSENPTARLGGSYSENNLATAYSTIQSDYLPDGLPNEYVRVLRGQISINPKWLFDFDFNKDIDEVYEPNKLSPFYYTMVHEILHLLGIGPLWFLSGQTNLFHAYSDYNTQFGIGGSSIPGWIHLQKNSTYAQKYGLIERSARSSSTVLGAYMTRYSGTKGNQEYNDFCTSKNILNNAAFQYEREDGTIGTGYYDTTKLPVGPSYHTQAGINRVNHVGEYSQSYIDSSGNLRYVPSIPNALMSSQYNIIAGVPAVLSRITLGMLEDLGYTVDYNYAAPNSDIHLNLNLQT